MRSGCCGSSSHGKNTNLKVVVRTILAIGRTSRRFLWGRAESDLLSQTAPIGAERAEGEKEFCAERSPAVRPSPIARV